jgi:hypothetical protein
MRTTINLDEEILQRAKRAAERSKLSLREVINRALRLGLDKLDPRSRSHRYRCTTYRMGFPPALNLDKALQLVAPLEDEETIREMNLRK